MATTQDNNANFTHSAAATAMNAQQSANTARGARTYRAVDISSTLSKAIIPALGANKLTLYGRGSNHRRDTAEGGRDIRIFNVLAFSDNASKERAKQAFLAGHKLEAAGDLAGAQVHYQTALYELMSFNVTAENADAFSSAYEITCQVEMVDIKERDNTKPNYGQVIGQRPGINRPRPVAVERRGTSVADDFAIPGATAQPVMSSDVNEALKSAVDNSGAGDTGMDE